jgi:6,7-dimethyl-8-ribityllumazine synthase
LGFCNYVQIIRVHSRPFVVKFSAMLRKIRHKKVQLRGGNFAIVASRYNARYVDAMVRAAQAELKRAGAKKIQIVRVPGAYEIPIVAKRLARAPLSAIICLGVILRGETVHAAHIGEVVSRALMQIQLAHGIPVIHEVLLLENEEQARVRCLNPKHNRGTEAAQTALAMIRVMKSLDGKGAF